MMSSSHTARRSHSRAKWKWQAESSLTTQLINNEQPVIELSDYHALSIPESDSPTGLLNGEGLKADTIVDLDIFIEQIYNYYLEKGLWCITTKWIVELLSVIFVLCFICFFLLVVDWPALHSTRCGIDAFESGNKPCNLAEVIKTHPLVPFTFTKGVVVGSMVILTIYGLFNFLKFIVQFKNTLKIREFYYNSINITDSELQTASWPVVLERVVQLQQSQQLCVVKDLSAHDIVMRLMRKENYLIGMLNKGVLSFPISRWLPGAGPAVIDKKDGKRYQLMLPKTLEWALDWCIFQSMFDSKFCIQREFLTNSALLKKRLMIVGTGMLLISPCLIIFMLVYLFLRHAEQFYHRPSTASSRRWSNLAKWMFREFNEVEHLFRYRISNSMEHASNYLKQFPSPFVTRIARFISFVSSGLAAVLIIIAFMDESLLEGHIYGRNLFWYAAVFGSVTAISQACISDELQVLDHEGAMSILVQYTHYMPKRWRGKENSDTIRLEFETLFQYTGKMLLEEIVSIFLTPLILIFIVPQRVDDILHFISDYTVYVDGVGNVCSFSVFDFESHGNRNYGSPCDATRGSSSQGKMEKSFLSFQSTYLFWKPCRHGQQLLSTLCNFKERHTQHDHFHNHLDTQAWRTLQGLRARADALHRSSPRNVFNNNDTIYRNAHFLASSYFMTFDRRNHPYILDWYYASKLLDITEDSRVSPSDNEVEFEPMLTAENNLQAPHGDEDARWAAPFSDRMRSHFETSTSSTLFKSTAFQNQDSSHHAMDRWWARTSGHSESIQASFLEPPTFGHNNYNHHSNELGIIIDPKEDTAARIEQDDHQNLMRTAYISESDNKILPFLDSYSGSYRNLTVKILPRSKDPIR